MLKRYISHKLKEFGPRRIIFSIAVLAYLGWLLIINALMFLPALGLFPDNPLSAMDHFGDFISAGDTHNLIHEVVFALIIGIAGIGLLSQLWKPKENFAGQWIAMIAWGAMIITAIITGNWVPQPLFITFGGLTILATILHPAGSGLFNWLRTPRINKALLILVMIAAIPFLSFAVANINEQRGGVMGSNENEGASNFFGHSIPQHGDNDLVMPSESPVETDTVSVDEEQAEHDMEHIALGHYRSMAAYGLIVILIGLLASFKLGGWRFAAWIAGLLSVFLGLASVVLPSAESSLGIAWGIATIVWGVLFITVAELNKKNIIKNSN